MSEPVSIEKAYSFTRTALPLMSRHSIPTTPLNYSIWYNYVAGENDQLTNIMDAMLKQGDPFTPETHKDLYSRYCSLFDEAKLKTLQDGLTKLMVALFSEVRGLSGHTENYESFLSSSMTQLSDDDSQVDFSRLIQDLIKKTQSVIRESKSMQEKLKETSKSLLTLQKDYEQAKKDASHDPLTGILNRKAFQEKADIALKEADSSQKPLSLIMADIDYFKYFNDTHGHLQGDEVLKFVAQMLKNLVKGQDIVARFGGEEFVVLLPGTKFEGALHVAEVIRGYFDRNELASSSSSANLGKISLSMGLAVYSPGESLSSLIDRADKSLYMAKDLGRNRVITERHLNP